MCFCVHRCEDSRLLLPSTSGDNTPRPLSSLAGISTNPVPPPRTRKSSSHNSLLLAPTATLLPGSVPDIQAATAIAGQISANQELPYMTPPISAPEMNPSQQQEVNFSGDSQDSSELLDPLVSCCLKPTTGLHTELFHSFHIITTHFSDICCITLLLPSDLSTKFVFGALGFLYDTTSSSS